MQAALYAPIKQSDRPQKKALRKFDGAALKNEINVPTPGFIDSL